MDKWDKRFMEMAQVIASWASCYQENRKIGAVIVKNKRIVTTGYNGAPAGLPTCREKGECLRRKLGVESGTRTEVCFAIHAEQNAIIQAAKLGISADFYKTKDIHVHFPEGAVPKDGPSAGITVCTAMVSALTGFSVRRDVAMTGEITLRGRVLPIGGLKEKTMAALRHGIRTVIIPRDNERDLEEIDQNVRNALHFVVAETVDTVLNTALNRTGEALPTILKEIPGDVAQKPRKAVIQQ